MQLKKFLAVSAISTAALFAGSGIASAKAGVELAGGGATAPSVCNPVSSLTAKSDPRVGETGLALTSVSYGVKPCVNNQAVVVYVTVAEYLNPDAVVYSYPDAPLNGKFVAAIKIRTTYKVTVLVVDAATGASLGSSFTYTAAVPKGV